MRILLDTNVWRYLVDTGSQNNLYKIARQSRCRVTVAPSVVIETLRLGDRTLRKRIIEVQTRDCWERLMPDAYLECEDIKREMARLHPEWELPKHNLPLFRKLRYDWIRAKGGFWEKSRTDTDAIADEYHSKDSISLEVVRQQSREVRASVVQSGNKIMSTKALKDVVGSWKTVAGEAVQVDGWRVYAMTVWENGLRSSNSPLRQWIGCVIDIDLLLSYWALAFVQFWESQVQPEDVPREWLRAAIYFLQSERKVTDGNPYDSAIAVHLIDVDIFVSADKNFVSMVNQIQDEAPFRTGSWSISRRRQGRHRPAILFHF